MSKSTAKSPAAVMFDAIDAATAAGTDVLIADTSGRARSLFLSLARSLARSALTSSLLTPLVARSLCHSLSLPLSLFLCPHPLPGTDVLIASTCPSLARDAQRQAVMYSRLLSSLSRESSCHLSLERELLATSPIISRERALSYTSTPVSDMREGEKNCIAYCRAFAHQREPYRIFF
jgi:hypothetical protein